MNEYSQIPDIHVSAEEMAFLSSLVTQLVREWNFREKDCRMTDTVSALLSAYRELYNGAMKYITDLFEFSVNESIGKWLNENADKPCQLAKNIFLEHLAAELPGKLEEMFEKLTGRTLDALNSRIRRELTDCGYPALSYNYLDLKDYQLEWSKAFTRLAVGSVFERMDRMQLDRRLPPCNSFERRKEIMRTAGITLVPRMEYEVNKISETIGTHYRSRHIFSEFSDEVSLSVWVWLERVKQNAEF